MARYENTGRKGHGCCGSIFTFFVVIIAIIALLFFTTDVLGGVKSKVMKHFYPQDYSQYVTMYAQKYDVDEALVYSVIRTESGFRSEVESSAGAIGLMQIMPDTFEWLQTLLEGEVIYDDSALVDPQINIEYGTYFLSFLLDHYDDKELLAVAAYNGGVANVDSWLSDEQYSSDGITLDDIPYNETAQYVKRVQNTKAVYETLYYDNNNN